MPGQKQREGVIGVLLVLLALVLVVRVQFATSDKQAYQALRVAQAVTHLEGGCLTCHSMLARTPPSAFPAIAHPQIDQPDWRLLADFATTTAAPQVIL
jgi:type II secretory pathway pseudopilin PulG